MTAQYQLTEDTDGQGQPLYTARHTGGQPIDWSHNRAAMEARVQQLNDGRPYSDWTAAWAPELHREQMRARHDDQHTCRTCGLDSRRCDCGNTGGINAPDKLIGGILGEDLR